VTTLGTLLRWSPVAAAGVIFGLWVSTGCDSRPDWRFLRVDGRFTTHTAKGDEHFIRSDRAIIEVRSERGFELCVPGRMVRAELDMDGESEFIVGVQAVDVEGGRP
jgi:hypothetical protein